MAKKETAKTAPATAASSAAAKVAAEVLKQNPDINEVHVTSDGTPFYNRNDAQNHARSLANREVFCHRRGTAVTACVASKAEKSAPDTPPAPSGQEIDELTGQPVIDEPAKTDE
mgnify:CR=1 FL=1|jgi:hypothetical protein